MNPRVSNMMITKTLQHPFSRYLSMKQIVNKSNFTFHRIKIEDRSPSFTLTRKLSQRSLCQLHTPVYTNFYRHISNEMFQIKNFDPLKIPVEQTQEVVESSGMKSLISDTADNILVGHVHETLLQLREATGLPWWLVIATNAFIFRTCVVLPFSINQMRTLAKLERIEIKMLGKVKDIKKDVIKAKITYGWPDDLSEQKIEEAVKKEWNEALIREKTHPMKSFFLMSIQSSTWITCTFATWLLCLPDVSGENVYNEMLTGGFAWVTNLTEADPNFVLPLALALVNLVIIEVHQSFRVLKRSSREQWKVIFLRLFSIGLIPASAYTPAAVNIYWLSSSLYGLTQALLLNSSPMRRLFRVPLVDPALKKPYRFFLNNLKSRLRPSKDA